MYQLNVDPLKNLNRQSTSSQPSGWHRAHTKFLGKRTKTTGCFIKQILLRTSVAGAALSLVGESEHSGRVTQAEAAVAQRPHVRLLPREHVRRGEAASAARPIGRPCRPRQIHEPAVPIQTITTQAISRD